MSTNEENAELSVTETTHHICGHIVNFRTSTPRYTAPPCPTIIYSDSKCAHCAQHTFPIVSPSEYNEVQVWASMLNQASQPQPMDTMENHAARYAWKTYRDSESGALREAKLMAMGNVVHSCGHVASGVEYGDGERIAMTKCEGCVTREARNELVMGMMEGEGKGEGKERFNAGRLGRR